MIIASPGLRVFALFIFMLRPLFNGLAIIVWMRLTIRARRMKSGHVVLKNLKCDIASVQARPHRATFRRIRPTEWQMIRGLAAHGGLAGHLSKLKEARRPDHEQTERLGPTEAFGLKLVV